jgi:anti-anti-sigma factor
MDTTASDKAMKTFSEKFREVKAESLKVVFELKGVDYVASSFIRLCLTAAKGVAKGDFSIVNTSPQVKKVFKLTGLDTTLNIT